MPKFYGSIKGKAKTMATRSADKVIVGHIRGWDHGIRVIGYHEDDEDCFDVYLTKGSNEPNTQMLICRVIGDGMEIMRKPKTIKLLNKGT